MTHTVEEHLFYKEYVETIEEYKEVKEMIEFLKKHGRHDLLRCLYRLFYRMASDAFKITGLEPDGEYEQAMEKLLESDKTLNTIHHLMHSN